MDIEIWEKTRHQNSYNTRNPLSNPFRLGLFQHLYIESGIVYGGPLRLDFGHRGGFVTIAKEYPIV